jgi:hypothetical protein
MNHRSGSGLSHLEVGIAVTKLKHYKLPGNDQISAELIQAGSEMYVSVIHKLINCIWNKEELSDQWKGSIVVPIHKKGYCNNYHGISLLRTSYKIVSNILLSRLSPYRDEIIGIIIVGFTITHHLLIKFSAFIRYWRKKGHSPMILSGGNIVKYTH